MPNSKPIHIARLGNRSQGYLFLQEETRNHYRWYQNGETTEIEGYTIAEALQHAHRHWRHEGITMIGCGFRYTLPERDEHGDNALFHQMVASYNSPNGVYFDEELGHNCYVQNASEEALALLRQLQEEGYVDRK